jgi:hypothetical protein
VQLAASTRKFILPRKSHITSINHELLDYRTKVKRDSIPNTTLHKIKSTRGKWIENDLLEVNTRNHLWSSDKQHTPLNQRLYHLSTHWKGKRHSWLWRIQSLFFQWKILVNAWYTIVDHSRFLQEMEFQRFKNFWQVKLLQKYGMNHFTQQHQNLIQKNWNMLHREWRYEGGNLVLMNFKF